MPIIIRLLISGGILNASSASSISVSVTLLRALKPPTTSYITVTHVRTLSEKKEARQSENAEFLQKDAAHTHAVTGERTAEHTVLDARKGDFKLNHAVPRIRMRHHPRLACLSVGHVRTVDGGSEILTRIDSGNGILNASVTLTKTDSASEVLTRND